MLKGLYQCYKNPSEEKSFYYGKLKRFARKLIETNNDNIKAFGISGYNCNFFTFAIDTKKGRYKFTYAGNILLVNRKVGVWRYNYNSNEIETTISID